MITEPTFLHALRARRLVIAHRGVCGPGAPENSLAAVAAAVDAGADAVEVDVRMRAGDGAFVLAHDAEGVSSASPLLREAMDVVRGRAFLNVDLKVSGCEDALARELRANGHVFVSTLDRGSARRLKSTDPQLAVSLSYPPDHAGARARALVPWVTSAVIASMRAALPLRIAAWVRETQCDALTLWHGVTSPRVLRAADALGVPVIAWTVNDAAQAAALRAMGVRGITTDDPRAIRETFA